MSFRSDYYVILASWRSVHYTDDLTQDQWRQTCPANMSVPAALFSRSFRNGSCLLISSYACPSLQSFFTTMQEPPQEVGDPHKVWQVFKSVFKNLNSARAASQELQYLTSLTQIVSEYPQALVATSTWPDKNKGRKRDAVTSALVRRLLLCQAVQESSTMSATVNLLGLVLSLLHKHSLPRYTLKSFTSYSFISQVAQSCSIPD